MGLYDHPISDFSTKHAKKHFPQEAKRMTGCNEKLMNNIPHSALQFTAGLVPSVVEATEICFRVLL
jgi:hypothetical protein